MLHSQCVESSIIQRNLVAIATFCQGRGANYTTAIGLDERPQLGNRPAHADMIVDDQVVVTRRDKSTELGPKNDPMEAAGTSMTNDVDLIYVGSGFKAEPIRQDLCHCIGNGVVSICLDRRDGLNEGPPVAGYSSHRLDSVIFQQIVHQPEGRRRIAGLRRFIVRVRISNPYSGMRHDGRKVGWPRLSRWWGRADQCERFPVLTTLVTELSFVNLLSWTISAGARGYFREPWASSGAKLGTPTPLSQWTS